MKHLIKLSALVLSLAVLLCGTAPAFSAGVNHGSAYLAGSGGCTEKHTAAEDPQDSVGTQYAGDETVRAIVLLEGTPEVDAGGVGSAGAAERRAKLLDGHAAVFHAMTSLKYTLKYEFTRLLNGFSCDIAYSDLETLAGIEGVEAVFVAGTHVPPESEASAGRKMNYANLLTNNSLMVEADQNGSGIVIAVLDSGLCVTHEAFADSAGWAAREAKLSPQCVQTDGLHAEGVYVSAKIPFAYDYAEGDADVTDHSGHGTHVSGIAAGMACTSDADGGTTVTFAGAAPAAQLLSMKIFRDAGGGTTSDVYFYALEDAYTLGADVINLSIGGQSGFTYSNALETELFGNIYQRLHDAGILVTVAAGNDFSMANYASFYEGDTGKIGPGYTDYGTVTSPATYAGNLSAASMENSAYMGTAIRINGADVPFYDACEDGRHGWLDAFGGTEQPYALITAADGSLSPVTAESLAAAEVRGKIAIVSRGGTDLEEMLQTLHSAGAVGCIVVNDAEGIFLISDVSYPIPAVSVQLQLLQALPATGSLYTYEGRIFVENPQGGQMSSFSNWGTTPMLTLDPAITSVGGAVLSAMPGGTDTYEVCSGTSMAAPNLAGTYANLLTALYGLHPGLPKMEAAQLAETLLYGSACLLTDENGRHYSPRKQGTGLATAYRAIETYRDGGYLTEPIQELGDDPEKSGIYTLSLTLRGNGERELYYTDFEAYVLYDRLAADANGQLYNTLTSDYAYYCNDSQENSASVTYTVGGVPVDGFRVLPGEEVTVQVTITLSEELKAYFDSNFSNGSFVEGYVIFREAQSGTETHATFLGYYGDWTQGSALETVDFRDLAEEAQPDFCTSPNLAWISAADGTIIAYAGDNLLGDAPYDEVHIGFSTPLANGSNGAEAILMEPYLLRNVSRLTMTVTDRESGECYTAASAEYIPKAVYDREADHWRNTVSFSWNGTDTSGNYVPSGTVATVSYDAVLPYEDTLQRAVWSFDVTVDYTVPCIEEVIYDEETQTLTVTASDENYLQAICLTDAQGKLLRYKACSSDVKGERFTAVFRVSDLAGEKTGVFYVTAVDYATNEAKTITFLYRAKACFFNAFSDCEAPWYHEAVDFAVAKGLMNGMGGDKFEPNTALSRAMVVTVLYRAAGEPEVAEPSTFTDVKDGLWYADAIAWAQDNGIVNGISATEFAPDENVTREQIATILWRYAGSPDASADLSAFGDADTVSGYAGTAIAWAVAEGIMNGDGKNLNPLDNATRAEFACMVMRYLEGSYTCNE